MNTDTQKALASTVSWPEVSYDATLGGFEPNGMGGTLVYAAWRGGKGGFVPDRMELQFDNSGLLLAGAEGPLAESFLRGDTQGITDLVLIGGSAEGIVEIVSSQESGDESGEPTPFVVTRERLSIHGLGLLELLEELHGYPATLLTYNNDNRWS